MKTNKIHFLKLPVSIFLAFAFVTMAPFASAQKTDAANTQIPSRFDVVKLTKKNLAKEVNKCIPAISADASYLKDHISRFPSNGITTYRNEKVANVFVVHQTTGLCLKLSPGKHPILAAEAFIETINPNGAPQNVVDGWYKQIAATIAKKGSAKIAYVFDNGNAFIVTYSVKPDLPSQLLYSMQFRKAGAWESEKLDSKFTHTSLSSVKETKRGGQGIKPFLLSHRNS